METLKATSKKSFAENDDTAVVDEAKKSRDIPSILLADNDGNSMYDVVDETKKTRDIPSIPLADNDGNSMYDVVDETKKSRDIPSIPLADNVDDSMYAVVDKTKKSRPTPSLPHTENDDASMYDVVDRTKKSRPTPSLPHTENDDASMYDVVDRTKKSRPTPSLPHTENDDASMYGVVDKTKESSVPWLPHTENDDASMYDVVDKTKESRVPWLPHTDDDVARLYAVVDKIKKSRLTTRLPHTDDDDASMHVRVCDIVIENPSTERSDANFSKKEVPAEKKKIKINYLCIAALVVPIVLLILVGTVVSTMLLKLSKISAEVALLQSTSPCISNISRLVMDVQLLENTIDTHFKIELDLINELNNQLRANITRLELDFENQTFSKATRNSSVIAFLVGILNETGHVFVSCASIRLLSPSSPSGKYHVKSSNGSAINAFCDMAKLCGGITGGWMRVLQLDMRDSSASCSSSLKLSRNQRRTCKIRNDRSEICSSDTFAVDDIEYSKVCGRIRAYQIRARDSFRNANQSVSSGHETNNLSIETNYVNGVSLTHGKSPRHHIWTFVGATYEDDQNPRFKCRCIINTTITATPSANTVPPPGFVGNDYFCGAALTDFVNKSYFANPLWDGAGCVHRNTCCSFNNPPWFYKQLPQSTNDGIEMRVCRDQGQDFVIEVVEIYVQ